MDFLCLFLMMMQLCIVVCCLRCITVQRLEWLRLWFPLLFPTIAAVAVALRLDHEQQPCVSSICMSNMAASSMSLNSMSSMGISMIMSSGRMSMSSMSNMSTSSCYQISFQSLRTRRPFLIKQSTCQSYAEHVPTPCHQSGCVAAHFCFAVLLRSCPIWANVGHNVGMPRVGVGRAFGAPWVRFGQVLGTPWAQCGHAFRTAWAHLGYALGMLWPLLPRALGMFLVCFWPALGRHWERLAHAWAMPWA